MVPVLWECAGDLQCKRLNVRANPQEFLFEFCFGGFVYDSSATHFVTMKGRKRTNLGWRGERVGESVTVVELRGARWSVH